MYNIISNVASYMQTAHSVISEELEAIQELLGYS